MKTAAFTLVELLVVIVVIAVLVAMGVPAYQKVVAKSRMVDCQNNLRQIGIGLNLYLNDHDRVFPGPLTSAQPVKYTQGSHAAMAMYLAPYLGLPVDNQERVNAFFLCPVYKSQVDTVRTYGIPLAECDFPFGYSGTETTSHQPANFLALSTERSGKETWLLKDIDRTTNGNSATPEKPAHDTVANYLFLDGSVRTLPLDYVAP